MNWQNCQILILLELILAQSQKLYIMKVMNKNRHKTSDYNEIINNKATVEKQHNSYRRGVDPIQSHIINRHLRRQSCPNIPFKDQQRINLVINDRSTAVPVSTRDIYDSRKSNNQHTDKSDWKILTLKEIKDLKSFIAQQHRMQQMDRKDHKIFVSIAKSNRNSVTALGVISASPKLCQIGAQNKFLRSISNKKNIIRQIQFQTQQERQIGPFLCK